MISTMYELGGFAEYPEDVDGDFEAFNSCLADEYLGAFYNEDFEATGDLSEGLFDNIREWTHFKDNVDKILDGTYMTIKGRNIIDACLVKRYGSLATILLERGVFSPRLVLAVLLSNEYIEPNTILDMDKNTGLITQEEFDERLTKIFDYIQDTYEKNKNNPNIDKFLLDIKNNIGRIHFRRKQKIVPQNYEWCKKIGELYGKN